MMMSSGRTPIGVMLCGAVTAVLCCASLLVATGARAEETVQITEAGFSPDALGVPTNAFGSATIGSTTGPVPSPITHVNVYGPAGVTLFDWAEMALLPTAFVAVTVNVYAVPFVRPG